MAMHHVTLMDGGMGQELYRRSGKPASPLWSAQVMMDSPELVVQLHRDYIDAGADVIEVNAYTTTPERLARDADGALFEPLQKAALNAATRARDLSGKPVLIAGCLPPLVASYHPDLVPDEQTARASYGRIIALQNSAVDLFLGETLSTVREGAIVARAAAETGKPVWISYTVDDSDGTRLRSGERLDDGVEAAARAGAEAVLVNCSMPEAVAQAMAVLSTSGLRYGGYANGFTAIDALAPGGTVDSLRAREDLTPTEYANHAMSWLEQGASLIGGCCEVGPAHIAEIRQRLGAAQPWLQ
jgi:homocysteine S-methyltransferase